MLLAAMAAAIGCGAIPAVSVASGPVRVGEPPPTPPGATADGPVAKTTPLDVTIALRPSDPGGLAAYANGVSTPGSPLYHQYLSVAQFAARFGPTPGQVSQVEGALHSAGLRSGVLSPNHLSLSVRASAGGLERAFSVALRRFSVHGRAAYANTSAPAFPADAAQFVQGVLGLSTLSVPRPAGLTVERGAHVTAPHVVTGGPQPCTAATQVGEYTADQIASAYRMPSLYGTGDLGAGQTIALYELEPNYPSDITSFQSCYGTSASVAYQSVDGGPGAAQSGDGLETELDVENALSLAPRASFIVYQGPNTDSGAYDTYNTIISQDRAQVVSTSWGLCEPYEGASAAQAENTLFQEAAVQGQSVFAASGDSGSEDCTDSYGYALNQLAVDDPASQPYVTGVGGTSLTSLGPPPGERVWNSGGSAGGGGISSLWTMPSYQSTAPSSVHVISTRSSAYPCRSRRGYCREVPDVSADADPNTGYAVLYRGAWTGVGGTSAAAPTWAALATLSNASTACAGRSVGFANPALYGAAGSAYSPDFNDIVSGSNDALGTQKGNYFAAVGYDMASGIGSPNAASLAAALCGSSGSIGTGGTGGSGSGSPATVTVTNPGSQSGTVGAAASLQIHATASDAGSLAYGATGLPPGLAIDRSSGLINGTPTSAGTYSVTVTATDASGPSGTASFTWSIVLAPGTIAKVTVVNPGGQSSRVGHSVALQISASDSDGGALTYRASGLPSGLTIDPASGLITGTASSTGSFRVTVTAVDATGPSGSASFVWWITK